MFPPDLSTVTAATEWPGTIPWSRVTGAVVLPTGTAGGACAAAGAIGFDATRIQALLCNGSTWGSVAPLQAASLAWSVGTIAFGNSNGTDQRSATLTNSGGTAANTLAITAGAGFSIAANNCPQILPGGGACQVIFTMAPGPSGRRSSSASAAASGGLTATIALTGTYTAPLAVWLTAANALPATLSLGGALAANGHLYYLGGYDGSSARANSYVTTIGANGAPGAWTETTALPQPTLYYQPVLYNNRIYVAGGEGPDHTNAVFETSFNSDGSLAPWVTTTPLPETIAGQGSVAYNGYLYTLCGSTAASYYAPINADGTVGAWAPTTDCPNVGQGLTAVVAGTHLYLVADTSADVYVNTFNADGSLGAWGMTSYPLPHSLYTPGVAVQGNLLVVIGGTGGVDDENAIYYAEIEDNGDVGPWITSPTPLPSGRYYNTALSPVVGNYVYVMGGRNVANQEVSTVFYASF